MNHERAERDEVIGSGKPKYRGCRPVNPGATRAGVATKNNFLQIKPA
jgi:hypothetical protein